MHNSNTTRHRILHVARDLLRHKGSSDTSVRQASGDSDVTTPTVSSRFDSKEGLCLCDLQAHRPLPGGLFAGGLRGRDREAL